MNKITSLSLKQKMVAEEWDTSSLLIDIRTQAEVDDQPLKGSLHIPMNELLKKLDILPKDKDLYFVCASGGRSDLACQVLESMGYKNTYSVEGGIQELLVK